MILCTSVIEYGKNGYSFLIKIRVMEQSQQYSRGFHNQSFSTYLLLNCKTTVKRAIQLDNMVTERASS